MNQPEHTDDVSKKSYERDQVVKIINSVILKMKAGDGFCKDTVTAELRDLQGIIETSVQGINSAGATDIKNKHIPTATDELETVIGATEDATGTIMDSCEAIQAKLDQMPAETATTVEDEVTRIFEACSFQDITGQRISKVVKALQEIDVKISKLLNALDGTATLVDTPEQDNSEAEGDGLLNGPQLPENAITQDDIDKLLAEFD